MILETEHIYLRPFQMGDDQYLLDIELRNRTSFEKTSVTHNDSYYTAEGQKYVLEWAIQSFCEKSMFRFAICLKENDRFIGNVSLNDLLMVPSLMTCFIGYSVDGQYQGKGYATQAVKLATDYGFKILRLHRIEAGVMPKNIASQRVLEKNGFVREGLARKNVHINGKWEDHYTYGCLNPYE